MPFSTPPSWSSIAQGLIAPAGREARAGAAAATALSLVATLALVAAELVALAVAMGLLYALTSRTMRRLEKIRAESLAEPCRVLRGPVRRIAWAAFVLLALGIVAYNTWLVVQGIDVPQHTAQLARSVTAETWRTFGLAVGELGLAAICFLLAASAVRVALRSVRASVRLRVGSRVDETAVDRLFGSVERTMLGITWWLIAALACWFLGVPQSVSASLLLILRLYVVVTAGVVLVRAVPLAIDATDRWLHGAAPGHGYLRYYDHLRRLRPTIRAGVEYALWIGTAALVIAQLSPVQDLAAWGPRLMKAIGIFVLGRVIVEIGDLEIGHRLLPAEGLDETERRRRATMVPLVRSLFTYAVYFGAAVLALASLGFNPMPFLAGAGILGLVVGFGAQSLINDVVSGFFILFENVYLVGDMLEVGGAKGVVEAIEFRVTKIRDAEGRVHIIRNGDMKPVINYSKDYALAVVPVEIGYDADLRTVFATLCEAGARVRASEPAVLAETRVDGIMAFGSSTMTVRTSTLVSPGRHETVAAALRLAIKEAFDRQTPADVPRRNLVPERAHART